MAIAIRGIHATIGEFQRNYLYYVFIDLPVETKAAILEKYPDLNVEYFREKVDIYNKSAVFPDRKTEPIEIKYSGEFIKIPGVDNSTREGDFEFHDDENMLCYKFFSALKDLTGNELNQAGIKSNKAMFDMAVAKISVDKTTITEYRKLVNVRVYGIEAGSEMKKEDNGVNAVKVSLCWDYNQDVPPNKRQKDLGELNFADL